MVDIDPGLDTKLRAFFEHIEASPTPPGLTDVDVTAPLAGAGRSTCWLVWQPQLLLRGAWRYSQSS